jgi:hypothetical protein
MVLRGDLLDKAATTNPMRYRTPEGKRCVPTGRFQKLLKANGGLVADQQCVGGNGARILPAGKISHEVMRLHYSPCLSEVAFLATDYHGPLWAHYSVPYN